MAWFDIVGGLAQGAQQGIGQVQADLARRKADALKDAAEKRALAAEARIADQEVERKIAEFIDRSDPSNLDPTEVQKFGAAAQPYITKATDGSGRLVARENPLKAKRRAADTLVLDDAPLAHADMVENRTRNTGTAREKDAARLTWNSGKSLGSAANVWAIGRLAGATEDEIVSRLSPKDQQAYISRTPAAISGGYNLAVSNAAAGRATAHDETLLKIAGINNASKDPEGQRETTAINNFMRQVITETPDIEQDELLARVGQLMTVWRQTRGTPAAPATAGGGPTWDPVAKAWK